MKAPIYYFKKRSTILSKKLIEECPSCGCPRISREPRKALDKAFKVIARFRCDKCNVATLTTLDLSIDDNGQDDSQGDLKPSSLAHEKFLQGLQQIKSDSKKAAFESFVEAAELGHASAQYNVGLFLVKGELATQDLAEAHRWLSLAAASGHNTARIALPKVEILLQSK